MALTASSSAQPAGFSLRRPLSPQPGEDHALDYFFFFNFAIMDFNFPRLLFYFF